MSTTATKSSPAPTRPRGAKGSKTKASKAKAKAKAKRASAKPKTASPKAANKNGSKRLTPGGLDGLVIGHMKKNPAELPATAGTVARGIKRSSGAVSNCLGRLEKAGTVRVTSKKPRKYDLRHDPQIKGGRSTSARGDSGPVVAETARTPLGSRAQSLPGVVEMRGG